MSDEIVHYISTLPKDAPQLFEYHDERRKLKFTGDPDRVTCERCIDRIEPDPPPSILRNLARIRQHIDGQVSRDRR